MYCDASVQELRGARSLRMKHTITELLQYHADSFETRVWRELGAVTQALDFARACERYLVPGKIGRVPERTRTGAHAVAGGIVVPKTITANLRRLRLWALNHPTVAM